MRRLDPPPAVLRLSGHPVRWQLLRQLSDGDRQVRELTALLGQQQSLVSYHLGLLRDGGLVRTRRSAADGRDTYYSLDLKACRDLLADAGAAVHPGLRLPSDLPPATLRSRRRVLFLCTGNSSRSQMAQAILEQLGGGRVVAASAGSSPKPLHPSAVRVMQERGIDISGRRPKHLDGMLHRRWDRVVSLCDRVREVCPEFPSAASVTHWSIPDPATEADGYPAFVRTADELQVRIQFLLHAI